MEKLALKDKTRIDNLIRASICSIRTGDFFRKSYYKNTIFYINIPNFTETYVNCKFHHKSQWPKTEQKSPIQLPNSK